MTDDNEVGIDFLRDLENGAGRITGERVGRVVLPCDLGDHRVQ